MVVWVVGVNVHADNAILLNDEIEGIRWLLLHQQLVLFIEASASNGQVAWQVVMNATRQLFLITHLSEQLLIPSNAFNHFLHATPEH